MAAPASDTPRGEVTVLLDRLAKGDPAAEDALMRSVHVELHRLALARLRSERRGHTLQATALVNEAYLRLCRADEIRWQDRAHFYRVAAQIMRRILVDYARRHRAQKRNDGEILISLDEAITLSASQSEQALEIDDLLSRLAVFSPRLAQVVEMRFYIGMSTEEIAAALGKTERTVSRDWEKARAWLHSQLHRS